MEAAIVFGFEGLGSRDLVSDMVTARCIWGRGFRFGVLGYRKRKMIRIPGALVPFPQL